MVRPRPDAGLAADEPLRADRPPPFLGGAHPAQPGHRSPDGPAGTTFNDAITQRFCHQLGPCAWPARATPTRWWASGRTPGGQRFAAIGDAAVGMHPVTAHGFNLGLHSMQALSQVVLQAHRRGPDIADPTGWHATSDATERPAAACISPPTRWPRSTPANRHRRAWCAMRWCSWASVSFPSSARGGQPDRDCLNDLQDTFDNIAQHQGRRQLALLQWRWLPVPSKDRNRPDRRGDPAMLSAYITHADCARHDMGPTTPNAPNAWAPSTTTCWSRGCWTA
jgi:hypothetical protein